MSGLTVFILSLVYVFLLEWNHMKHVKILRDDKDDVWRLYRLSEDRAETWKMRAEETEQRLRDLETAEHDADEGT